MSAMTEERIELLEEIHAVTDPMKVEIKRLSGEVEKLKRLMSTLAAGGSGNE